MFRGERRGARGLGGGFTRGGGNIRREQSSDGVSVSHAEAVADSARKRDHIGVHKERRPQVRAVARGVLSALGRKADGCIPVSRAFIERLQEGSVSQPRWQVRADARGRVCEQLVDERYVLRRRVAAGAASTGARSRGIARTARERVRNRRERFRRAVGECGGGGDRARDADGRRRGRRRVGHDGDTRRRR